MKKTKTIIKNGFVVAVSIFIPLTMLSLTISNNEKLNYSQTIGYNLENN